MVSEFEQLRARRDQLAQQLTSAKAAYKANQVAVSNEVAGLRAAADGLAAEFKSLFAAASAAYASEDKAAATSLAAQGRAALAQCKALNAQANSVNETLDGPKHEIERLQSELANVRAKLSELRSSAKKRGTWVDPTRHIQVSGFEFATGINEALVRSTLSMLPPRLLDEIGEVRYIDMFTGMAGSTDAKPNMATKSVISVYRSLDFGADELRNDLRETLLHESGHVLFARFTDGIERFKWGAMFNRLLSEECGYISELASMSMGEDAAECFLFYMERPGELYERFPKRYTFIDKLYKEASK